MSGLYRHVGSVQTWWVIKEILSVCRANVSGKQRSDVGQTDICSRNRFRLWKGVSVDHLMDDAVIDAQIVGLEH